MEDREMAFSIVSPDKEKQLLERMRALGVREQDVDEQFVRSSGAGGQKVNKVSTCVLLHHRPTGIRVKCQQERSQALNRFLARRILLDTIEAKLKGAQTAEAQRIAKIRRQKKKRSKRAKLRLLADKRHQSEKKSFRASVRHENDDD
jgi:protein subunit release factor B